MNGTFNAYLLQNRPKLKQWRQHVTMNRNMMLKDDIKEYWGFYLLRGSVVKLSVCSRHEGASFIVVRDLKNARRCAFLGELDSEEESDEDSESEEFEFAYQTTNVPKKHSAPQNTMNVSGTQTEGNDEEKWPSRNQKNMFSDEKIRLIMENFRKANDSQKYTLVWKMLQAMNQDPNSEEVLNTAKGKEKLQNFLAFQVNQNRIKAKLLYR